VTNKKPASDSGLFMRISRNTETRLFESVEPDTRKQVIGRADAGVNSAAGVESAVGIQSTTCIDSAAGIGPNTCRGSAKSTSINAAASA
jgi:hypothetical protein